MNNGFFIAGSVFILIMLLGFLAIYYSNIRTRKKGIQERIRKEASPEQIEDVSKGWQWKTFLQQTISRFGEVAKPTNEGNFTIIRTRLMRAGYYGEKGPAVLLGAKTFMAILLPIVFMILKFTVMKIIPVPLFLLFIILSAVAGFYLPDYYLHLKTKERKRIIFEGFPSALDLMIVCVEAGMGLDGAIKRVGDEMTLENKPLSEEFRMLSLELRGGKPRADALRNLAARTDLEDVSSLTTLLIQTDRFGTRVAQALRVHSDSMRTKRYQRAEELAAKLPVKIVIPLIFFIFPSLFVTIIGPAVIRIYRNLIVH